MHNNSITFWEIFFTSFHLSLIILSIIFTYCCCAIFLLCRFSQSCAIMVWNQYLNSNLLEFIKQLIIGLICVGRL